MMPACIAQYVDLIVIPIELQYICVAPSCAFYIQSINIIFAKCAKLQLSDVKTFVSYDLMTIVYVKGRKSSMNPGLDTKTANNVAVIGMVML